MGNSSTGIEEYIKKIKPKHYPIIAFIITAVLEALIFSLCGMSAGGDYVIARSDMAQQYLPFIRYFCDAIKGNKNFFYSWGMDFGMGMIGTYAYYTMSPLNILFLLANDSNLMMIATVVIILKSSLSACFFQLFASKFLKNDMFETVLMAVMYGLCGYSVIFYFNIIWTDSLYLFPLILLGVYKLIKENKCGLLFAAYTLQFYTSFYMSYSVGIISFVMGAVYFAFTAKKRSRKLNLTLIAKYVGCVILAMAITSFVWLPGAYQIIGNLEPLYEASVVWQSNPILLLNNMFMNQMQTLNATVPYIYAGVIQILLIPLYFVNKRIGKREKIFAGSILLMLLMSFLISPFRIFLHAFDNPEMFAYRYSFMFSFVACLIGCRQITFIREYSNKIVGIVLLLWAVVYVVSGIICYERGDKGNCNTWQNALINVIFIAGWLAIIWIYEKKKTDLLTMRLLMLILVCTELVVNSVCGINKIEHKPSEKILNEYYAKLDNNTLDEIMAQDSLGYFRVGYRSRHRSNTGLLNNFSSTSYFNSVENKYTNRALKNLGMQRVIHLMDSSGLMPITNALLAVKYTVNTESEIIQGQAYSAGDIYNKRQTEGRDIGMSLYTVNDRVLSLGYMVENAVKDYEFEISPFRNMDSLLSAMTGENIICFEETGATLSCDKVTYAFVDQDHNSEYLDELNADVITYLQHAEDSEYEEGTFTYTIKVDDRPLYAYLNETRFYSFSESNDVVTISTVDETDCYEYSAVPLEMVPSKVFKVGHNESGDYEFKIIFPKDVRKEFYEEQYFCYYDDSQFNKAYDILSKHQWDISEFEGGYINGTISADEDGIMFTSIPYDEGWSVYVDNEPVQKEALLEGAFVGVPVPSGKHQVEMVYKTPLLNVGAGISLASLAVLLLIILAKFFFSRKMVRVSDNKAK